MVEFLQMKIVKVVPAVFLQRDKLTFLSTFRLPVRRYYKYLRSKTIPRHSVLRTVPVHLLDYERRGLPC